ncbi:MAG: hypothetical protein H6Q86_2321 [candidate division NC10 bacterium]|jgi:uncharacterized membrane protein|nr:hypothetical protein [candidate division NC10 bacterium]
MQPYDLHFFPYPPLYLLAFLLLLGFLLVLLRWGLIRYVYERLGLSRRAAMVLLFAALVGSGINIPLMQLPAQRVVEPAIVNFFGMQYVVPRVVERGGSVLAVNVGGAIIPVLVALRLIRQHGITRRLLLSFGMVTVLMYHLAQPIPGVGIALPPLLPSVATAVIALVLDRRAAPRTAFIAGTLGTLVGADLLNLGRIRDLGAPVVSIGGAGTFDGVFMIGIVAVLLAGLPGSRRETPPGEAPAR